MYVFIIIGGREGVVVAGGGGAVGVAAEPGTKFVVQTNVRSHTTGKNTVDVEYDICKL
jgi:hypothetical protein